MNSRHFAAFFAVLAACGPIEPERPVGGPQPRFYAAQSSAVTAKYKVTIRPHAQPNLCVAAPKDGQIGALVLANCDGSDEQLWSRFGKRMRGHGDKCMAIDEIEKNGAKVTLTACDPSGARDSWQFTDRRVAFGEHGDSCLDLVNNDLKIGAQLQIWRCQDDDEAQDFGWVWALEKMGQAPDEETKSLSSKPAQSPSAVAPQPVAEHSAEAKPAEAHAAAPKVSAPAPQPVEKTPLSGVFGWSPGGTTVAPYYYAWWSQGSNHWLVDAKKAAGLSAATMAFGLSGGGCKLKGFEEYTKDMKAFRASGGTLILSYGGQAGIYPQTTCTNPEDLAAALLAEAAAYTTNLLDFDVEGENLKDNAAHQRLAAALAIVQKKQPNMYVSVTLPVDPDAGIPGTAVQLLQILTRAGVRVSRVNIMAMDYGRKPRPGYTVGDLAIKAAKATGEQMKKIWPKATQAEIYHALGITPMIGQNDGNQDGPFLVTDAQKVAAWSKQNGIGHLAYWAFQRDVAKSGDYNDHSNHQTADYQFYRAFLTAVK